MDKKHVGNTLTLDNGLVTPSKHVDKCYSRGWLCRVPSNVKVLPVLQGLREGRKSWNTLIQFAVKLDSALASCGWWRQRGSALTLSGLRGISGSVLEPDLDLGSILQKLVYIA